MGCRSWRIRRSIQGLVCAPMNLISPRPSLEGAEGSTAATEIVQSPRFAGDDTEFTFAIEFRAPLGEGAIAIGDAG